MSKPLNPNPNDPGSAAFYLTFIDKSRNGRGNGNGGCGGGFGCGCLKYHRYSPNR